MTLRVAGIGTCVLGLMVASVAAEGTNSSNKAGQSNDASSLTLVGCVERDNGNLPAGAAGQGTSTAANATSGTNADAFRLTKLDASVLSQAADMMGKSGDRHSAGNAADSAQTAPTAVPNSTMDISKAKDFVLRPASNKTKFSSFVGKRVQVKGNLTNSADAMAGPNSAGANASAGASGTVSTSNLSQLAIQVSSITALGPTCK